MEVFWRLKKLQSVIFQLRFAADMELGVYYRGHIFHAADAHAEPRRRLRVGEIGGQQAGEMVLAVRENGGGVGYSEAAAEDHPVLPAARPLLENAFVLLRKFLLRYGADDVAYPEKQFARWAAIRYTANHLFGYIELDSRYAIVEVEVPPEWLGKSIGELEIRRKYGINVLAIKQNDITSYTISPEMILTDQMTLKVLGEYKALQKHFHL